MQGQGWDSQSSPGPEEGSEWPQKGVCRQFNMKKRSWKMWVCCKNGAGGLLIRHMEDSCVLSAFFTLIFTVKFWLLESQAPETWGKFWSKADLPLLEEDLVKKHLNNLDIHKSLELDGLQPAGAEGAVPCHCQFSLRYLWKVGLMNKTSENWKKANVIPVFKKEHSGNNKPLSLTSVFQK